ncbi:MAG: hypothetical protein FWG98_00840 [Candidatus Cloacimonetes bacterium]|nr:hypothetical protein [Candidatus Cloacimonadota bacterium]
MKNEHFAVEDFIDWLNIKFLFHTTWQINAEVLKKDSELLVELTEKKEQMSKWAKELLRPAYIYIMVGECFDFSNLDKLSKINPLAYQVVTLGMEAVLKAKDLKENGEYLDYFYWHGFCSALTEALAARVHAMVRVDLGLEKENEQSPEREFKQEFPGKRLSFGYEALPDMREQIEVLQILQAQKIGITATESGMLEPEYSTCAVVVGNG